MKVTLELPNKVRGLSIIALCEGTNPSCPGVFMTTDGYSTGDLFEGAELKIPKSSPEVIGNISVLDGQLNF